jgi:tetratricopeptide (TPR) repeat protein
MGLRVKGNLLSAPRADGTGRLRMNFKITAWGMLLATSALLTASPALAQYGARAPASPAKDQPANSKDDAKQQKTLDISKQVRPAIVELEAAVKAKDTANIPAKVAAALAKAKTANDRYLISQLQLKSAVDANDMPAAATAVEAMIATGVAPASELPGLYDSLGKIYFNAKAYDKAGAAFEKVTQLQPSNTEAMAMLAETRNSQGRIPDAVAMIQKAIATKSATGQKAEENWYKRAVALAYNSHLPNAPTVAREWVGAYPNPKNWHDAIRIYQTATKAEDASLLDSMRLAQVTGGLSGESDYFRFANTLVTKGYAGEAKLVLEQGFAANAISKTNPSFSQLYSVATAKSQGDRASLAASGKAAAAGSDAKKVMVVADAFYGYGDYAQAAELYRAALGKAGVDKDLANLRLGMTLVRSGDKAGATTALNAAGGAQAELAKLWLAYLATKA